MVERKIADWMFVVVCVALLGVLAVTSLPVFEEEDRAPVATMAVPALDPEWLLRVVEAEQRSFKAAQALTLVEALQKQVEDLERKAETDRRRLDDLELQAARMTAGAF